MATDDAYALLYNKKILPLDQMKTKFLDYLVGQVRKVAQDTFGTDATLGTVATTLTASASNNKVDIAKLAAFSAVSGSGRRIACGALDSRLQGIKIPPNAGVVYNVGIEQNDVEQGIEINPRTGSIQYVSYLESMGRVGNPTSVVDNGNGTLTLNVNSLVESGDDHSGRNVRVWLKQITDGGIGPLSPSAAVAIQTIAIVYNAPNNTITIPNLMGQTVASTVVGNYWVQLIGPTVKRVATENLQATAGTFYLGQVTSVATGNLITTIDTSAQNVISISLADTDTHIADLESLGSQLTRSGVSSGFANTSNVGLTFNIASGVAWLAGTRRTPIVQALALTNSTVNYVYVDTADGVTKTTTVLATALGPTSLLLYRVTTAGGAVTLVEDLRRFLTRANSRDFITVGAVNCDFTSLEGAYNWLALNRAGGETVAAEIVIQGSVVMTSAIALQAFPVIIRGVATDANTGVGGPLCKLTTPAGVNAFNGNVSITAGQVTVKDLYVSLSTASSGTSFLTQTSGQSDGWCFDNVWFDGGNGASMFSISPGASQAAWTWNRCIFKNSVQASAKPYVFLSANVTGAEFTGCRFIGETTDAFVEGIEFSGATECHLQACEFNTGGYHIKGRSTADQNRIERCRFKASRLDAVNLTGSGEFILDDCYFSGCMTNGSNVTGVVSFSGAAANCVIRNSRIKDWQTGFAVFANAGTDHRIENNIITTSAATPSVGVQITAACTGTCVMGNDIDLLTTATAGAGKASGQGIQATSGVSIRICNNKIKNAGSSGAGGQAIQLGAQSIASCNIMINCRGQGIVTTAADAVIMGNIIQAGMVGGSETGIMLSSGDNMVCIGNVVHAATSASPIQVGSFQTGIHVLGNAIDKAYVAAQPIYGGAVRRLNSQTFGSTVYANGTTVVGTVPYPAHTVGVHLPCNVLIPSTPSASQWTAGIRIKWSDGTNQDILQNVTSPTKLDLIGLQGTLVSSVDDLSVMNVQFIVNNSSTSASLTVGPFVYEGYVIG